MQVLSGFNLRPEMTKQGNTFYFNRNFLPFAKRERTVGIPTQYTRANTGRDMNKRGGRPYTFYLAVFFMMTSAFLYFSNSSLKAELDQRSDEISDLNNAKLQKMQAIDVLQAELEKTQHERNIVKNDLDEANENIETRNSQIENLKFDIGKLESEKSNLESERDNLKDDKLYAENQLDDLEELRAKKNELENIVEENKLEMESKNAEIEKLKKDLEDAETLIANIEGLATNAKETLRKNAAENVAKAAAAPAPKIVSLEAKPAELQAPATAAPVIQDVNEISDEDDEEDNETVSESTSTEVQKETSTEKNSITTMSEADQSDDDEDESDFSLLDENGDLKDFDDEEEQNDDFP
ncbi:Oidioi.mRNA.OKI2018_I69.PAR.g11256.t1.cds [Oikopleura dioica]|uniref:Oidioi.mRNA.OKI2018_I69.PAR.g11256.t1.cds n=1 Tax=Oikopleura dioica TaxID=34765 RepID=A0ABN7RZM4_OIKDI|nr:Oidioi.mRNA.OKI2018_I69.PAR.g11256.t1.cds [Oikopleura dioica]